ncbi:MAG: RNA polymerase sigma factor [Bacteroidales bacterium]|nr:RNA polymerase sigma factor [Bacteroidales bacterium]MCF8458038.1 RNA polymerase sigma factor [Bacteroidales bacterium]
MLRFIKNRQNKSSGQELPSEELLIARYREAGDPAFVGELFDPYVHLVFGLCMKYLHDEDDSKDAVMQIFENILRDLKSHEVRNFKSWLYMVSKNHCLKQKRREKLDQKYVDAGKSEKSIPDMEIEEAMAHTIDQVEKRKNDALHLAVAQLKGPQRQCIELVYLQEKSYREVVEMTGFELGKVKSYVQNGKRNLRIILAENSVFKELFEED